MTRSIQDVQANGSDTPLTAAASAHSITLPGSATNLVTTTTYDDQGRVETTTIPTGRVMAMFYSKLDDGRFAALSVPRRTGTSPLVYHGPVSYSVTNQAGRSEGSGVLALAGGSNDAQSIASWIDITKSDPIQAIVGTYASVVRYSATTYNKAGTMVEESRVYHTLYSTLAGSTADVTKVAHDNRGRVIRTEDPTGTISRTDFDDIGRPVARWIGTDDTGRAGSTMSGTDNMTQVEAREYDGITNYTSGGLGKNSHLTRRISDEDGDWTGTTTDQRQTVFKYDYRGRPQITAMFYDDLDRPIATVQYGTYNLDSGSGTFTRSSITTVPGRSPTVLVSETTYTKDGLPEIIADPLNQKTKYVYDAAGRRIITISNYDGTVNSGMPSGAFNNFVRNQYTNGLQTKLWVDLDGDNTQDTGDQVTLYTYGVPKGTLGSGSPVQSELASNRLLAKTTYPDSASGTDVVTHAYSALGEQVWNKDQHGTIIQTEVDTGGRQTARNALAFGTNIDNTVQRIEVTYTNRGQPYEVTQYTAPSSGSVVNQVKYTYDDYGYATQMDQDFDSVVGGSGAAHRSVTFANTRAAPTNGRTSIRRTAVGLADGGTIDYTFSSSSSLDDLTGRVTSVDFTPSGGSPTTVAEYEYLGRTNLVTTGLNPGWISTVRGASAGTFDGLDRFNRIKVSKWTDGVNDRQRFNIDYDENSNIKSIEDPILDNYTASTPAFDKTFSMGLTMDGRNRITEAKRGVMSMGSITGTARMDNIWTLDQVGNWDNVKTDLDGDSNGTDAGEVNENRTFNTANEILTRSTAPRSLVHDAAGQMTHDGNNMKFTYDAFGRLVRVYMYVIPSGLSGTIAEYKYDGLGQRIGWHCDLNLDNDVTTADPWMWFIYDDRWRIVNTYRLAWSSPNWVLDSDAKERFIHHAAGIDGRGGSSYIDAVILSDRDLSNAWSGAADGTLEARLYHLQNWRNDLCAVMDGGIIAKHYRYSAYGTRTEIDEGDYNRDGVVDFFDILDFNADLAGDDARADINRDDPNDPDFADYLDFVAACSITSDDNPHSAPRGLYAGYEHDAALEYAGPLSGGGAYISTIGSYAHVRNRVYSTELGRWTRRDPLGYIDGSNLYQYCRGQSINMLDASGLWGSSGHYYTIYLAAVCAGHSPAAAEQFAYYAQYPDQDAQYDAKKRAFRVLGGGGLDYMILVHTSLHSLTGGNAACLRSCLLQLFQSGDLSETQKAVLLHAIGDAWAHTKSDGNQYSPGAGHVGPSLTPKLLPADSAPTVPSKLLPTPFGLSYCATANCCPDNISNNRAGYFDYFTQTCVALGGNVASCMQCALDADTAMFMSNEDQPFGYAWITPITAELRLRKMAMDQGLPSDYRPGDMNLNPKYPSPSRDEMWDLMAKIRAACGNCDKPVGSPK